MTWDQFWADVLVAVEPLVLALIAAALGWAVAWLKAKTSAIKSEEARRVAQNALGYARAALYASVKETWQTYVGDIKAASADGKLSPEERRVAKEKALAAFQARLGPEAYGALRQVVGDVMEWASHELEALIPDLKQEVEVLAAPKLPASASAPSA